MTEPAILHPQSALAPQSEASAILHMVERVARDPAVNMDVLERLMAMRERVVADERRIAFNRAIGAAKAEMPEIKKNKQVSFGNGKTAYEYEDLAEIERTIKETLEQACPELSLPHRQHQQAGHGHRDLHHQPWGRSFRREFLIRRG